MTLGRKTLLAATLAAALLVPAAAATAGNGNGHGNGNGPPAWAGGGSGGAKTNGKPAWAGQGQGQGQAKKAEKAQAKLDRKAARDAATADEDGPKHQNPAWVCKFERESLGAEGFAAEYGDAANAFGKCVSREAHDRDGVTVSGEEPFEEPGEAEDEPEDGGIISEDDPALVEALAALQSLLEALRQIF